MWYFVAGFVVLLLIVFALAIGYVWFTTSRFRAHTQELDPVHPLQNNPILVLSSYRRESGPRLSVRELITDIESRVRGYVEEKNRFALAFYEKYPQFRPEIEVVSNANGFCVQFVHVELKVFTITFLGESVYEDQFNIELYDHKSNARYVYVRPEHLLLGLERMINALDRAALLNRPCLIRKRSG